VGADRLVIFEPLGELKTESGIDVVMLSR